MLMKFSASIGAGVTIPNVLSGSAFEFLRSNAEVSFGIVSSATGIVATVQSGADVLMEESPISTANRFPIWPDDFDLVDVAAAGERLVVKLRNTTGGALTYFVTVKVDEV